MSHVSDSFGEDRALYWEKWSIKAENFSGREQKHNVNQSLYVSIDGQSVRDSSAKRDSRTRSEISFTGVSCSTVYRASQAALLTDL